MPSGEFQTIEDIDFNFTAVSSGHNPSENVWKTLYLKGIIIVLIGVIFLALFNLQVVNGAKFKQLADDNRIYVEPIIAPRGIIYDRNGKPLVYNKDTFKVVIDTNIFDDKNRNVELPALANILGMKTQDIVSQYTKGVQDNASFITVAQDITKDQMIAITTNPLFAGIRVEPSTVREYPYKDATSNILGYIGQVSDADMKANPTLHAEDSIGKDGLEYQYDKLLRGVDGENIIEVDTNGNKVSVIKEQDPIPGDNLTLSLDINAQQQLYTDVLQGIKDSSATGGAGIIQNVNDGSILAMVSGPSYDDNLFSQGISASDYEKLINDPHYPLINRAIGEAQPPGSVLKTITASAALQENAITPTTIFDCEGVFEFGGQQFQDYDKIKRGKLTVVGGLQWSSNIFFYNTILQLGINKLVQYEKEFGAGSPTGIDLPGEVPGLISSPQEKQERTGQVWYGGDSLIAAIGQGDNKVTPIQVVNWITSIANEGTLFKPQLVMQVDSADNKIISSTNPQVVRQKFVNPQDLDIVKQGMHAAVHQGIDRTLDTSAVDLAGKTGTAEFGTKDANGNYTEEHAWASGFAPYNRPQISFVVFLEAGGLSTSSERVAKNFLNWYYGIYLKANPNIL